MAFLRSVMCRAVMHRSMMHRAMMHRAPVVIGRVLPLTILLLVAAACRKDSTGPNAAAAAIRLDGGNGQSAAVGTVLALPLRVVVTDASGKPVANTRVDWDASVGAGSVSPGSSNSNTDGVATSVWTLGTVAGTLRATAQVGGLAPIVFTATAVAGAATSVVATPDQAFLGVGDTIRVRAAARDQFGNDLSGQALTFTALDAATASISSTGLVTALGQGNARVVAAASGRADTVAVTVGPPGSSVCGPIAERALAVGEVYSPDGDVSGARACLTAPVGVNAEYALTLISTATSFGSVTPLDVFATGNTAPTTAADAGAVAPFGSVVADVQPQVVSATLDARRTASNVPFQAELDRRAMERRALTPLVASARAWHAERQATAALSVAADLKVGDAITLNANASKACSDASNRAAKVVAVGTRSIVVADDENPAGGYDNAEYASIAATFDTLVYPLDTTAFGAPSNVSGHGKIILFYTRNVNALTPPSTSSFTIGGFFFARDLYPKTARNGLAACAASNEAEMFYLLVPDPTGSINSNPRSKNEVTTLNLGTIAHEFEHLINAGRRLYVNTASVASEETWLDEGLAHTAEELLYFRMTGFSSRQNLTLNQVAQQSTLFSNFASQNFSRFYAYLLNPRAELALRSQRLAGHSRRHVELPAVCGRSTGCRR